MEFCAAARTRKWPGLIGLILPHVFPFDSRTQFRIRDLISELCLSFGNSCLEDVNPLCQQKHNLLLIHQKVCCSLFILLPYDVLLFLSTVSRNFLVADYDIVYFSFSLPSILSYCSSYVLRFFLFFLSLASFNKPRSHFFASL
jgi:hypothetical protein